MPDEFLLPGLLGLLVVTPGIFAKALDEPHSSLATSANTKASTPSGALRVGINGAPCAFTSIASAIAAAQSGDQIYIEAGNYNERLGLIRAKTLSLTASTAGSDCSEAGTSISDRVTVDATGLTDSVGTGGILDIRENSVVSLETINLVNGTTGQGGLVTVQDSSLTVISVVFQDGRASADRVNPAIDFDTDLPAGGCIYAENSTIYLERVFFEFCRVTGSTDGVTPVGGGAIHARKNSSVEINTADFVDNTAETGGAVLVNDSDLKVRNASFISNNAAISGAVDLNGDGPGRLVGPLFDNVGFQSNSAGSSGGAVSLRNTTPKEIVDTDFIENSAIQGGAISQIEASTIIRPGQRPCFATEQTPGRRFCSLFRNNVTIAGFQQGGSAVHLSQNSESTVSRTAFVDNGGPNVIDLAETSSKLNLESVWFESSVSDAITARFASQVDAKHLTITNSGGFGYRGLDESSLSLSNSIITGNAGGFSGGVQLGGGTISTNCNFEQSGQVGSTDDPMLVADGSRQAQLRPGSPAVDACSPVNAWPLDLEGNQRLNNQAADAGAFEYTDVLFGDRFQPPPAPPPLPPPTVGFGDEFAHASGNWDTFTQTFFCDGAPDGSSVVTTDTSVELDTADRCFQIRASYTHVGASGPGRVFFDYQLDIDDPSDRIRALYGDASAPQELPAMESNSGSRSFLVIPGQPFTFQVSFDKPDQGRGGAQLTISSFRFEPSP